MRQRPLARPANRKPASIGKVALRVATALAGSLILCACLDEAPPPTARAPRSAEKPVPAREAAPGQAVGGPQQWMSIVTAEGGYRFQGARQDEPWSFEVPGRGIRTHDDHGRMFADIDGVVVQVMAVPLAQFPGNDPLGAHRDDEANHFAAMGSIVTATEDCASLPIPHREWRATLHGVSTSQFLTVATSRAILVVVVANGGDAPTPDARAKWRGICATLAVPAPVKTP
jgi:hypothetical protein